jgi:6-phospho-3-hexuloisomerase
MINQFTNKILKELTTVLSKVDSKEVHELFLEIQNANKIVCCGAGRVGMAIKGFAMRLGHMGYQTYNLGDTTVPSIGKGDLFIVASGSGETQTIYDLVQIAKKNEAKIFLITGNKDSRIGKLANKHIKVIAPSKTKPVEGFTSIQPMTTLNEQSLSILFDAIVLYIMEQTGETHDSMWNRHSNLE